ncbi:hypothetical protein E6H36_01215 [Candidatus Bathyarchaeota archaeon]|nr:MAG: hypothetical protein E6H36_01215 [Candidatus Bathyarchaeota archaeon]
MLESSIASEKTKPAHAMFKATMNDARLFRNLLGAISSLIEEADFNATPEGIKLRSMDPSHIAMVDFEWPKTAFDTYECNGNTKITRKFITPTLEPSTEEVPTPKVPFNARVKITAASLRDIIDDAQAISDNVKLEVTPDKFTVRATGELSSALIELDKGSDAILDIDAKEPTKATYNLNYLGEIIRAGSGASEVTSLEFSTNMPIKVEFEMPQQGRLLYYLAPRIESE